VIEAGDGSSARDYLRSASVGAVLLDVYMPGLDGLALLDEFEDPPPVALLTAHEYNADIMTRRSKVALYIQKPVAPTDLLDAVERLIPGD
jgi:DNA-binding response OmpR family regulator